MRRLALCTLIVICATPLSAGTEDIDAAIARHSVGLLSP